MLTLTRRQQRFYRPSWGDVLSHAWPGPAHEWNAEETRPEPVFVETVDQRTGETIRTPTGDETVSLQSVAWAERNPVPPPTEAEIEAAAPAAWLATARATAKRIVDRRAEGERLQHITPGDGQALVYVEKLAEARAVVALGGKPAAGDYPLLAAEGEDIVATADAVLAQAAGWKAIAADIERRRLGSKRDIDAAADIDAVEAVLAAGGWIRV
ncbi:MAG: hypothetical protein AB7O45_10605 [Alphaproteobacteria bacterium]